MSSIWDVVNSINFTKEEVPGAVDVYVPFVVNRSLSYFSDTVLYANEMNLFPDLDKIMQYEYYLYGIRKRKRFSKWTKKAEDTDIEMIAEYYSCNYKRAEEYASILSKEQIDVIKKHLIKGGY